ncbi:MAG: hypothetical protein ACKODX_21040 [Gemmata sp.]
MSVLRIKTWIMTAACAGLIGLAAGDAHAFCGKLFKKKDACDPCATAPAAGAGTAHAAPTQKVKVTEWVPTYVEETVTVMKPVTRQENYTAHKWECVPEVVTSQVTVNKLVTENVTENRTVTERVPVQKTITVNETHWKTVMVTEMKSKTVTHKVQVPFCETKGPSFADRIKACCDPCYTACPRTVSGCRTEKHSETVCEPVTVCKKVAECVPVTKTVCTFECRPVQKTVCAYECVTKTVPVTVCKTRCVPTVETVTKTINVRKCVAYQATRNVTECVPVQEKVKVCKMVAKEVEKDVAIAAPACGNGCDSCAKAGLLDRIKSGMGGIKAKFSKCKSHGSDCGCADPAACGAAAGCCK